MTERALVLGPGGAVGTAWLAGLAVGLRSEGVDLAEADRIVGTSAGSIVGVLLATGQDPARLERPARSAKGAPATPDMERVEEVFTVLAGASLDPDDARREVGRIALAARAGTEEAHIARMENLTGAPDWPGRGELLITSVDVETGESAIWSRESGVPLATAVAASCAMAGAFPPITIDGRRYMDGAFRAGSNADLAGDARTVIVIEPLAHLFPATPSRPGSVVSIGPGPAALKAYGPDLFHTRAWTPSYEAGIAQAPEAAEQIRSGLLG